MGNKNSIVALSSNQDRFMRRCRFIIQPIDIGTGLSRRKLSHISSLLLS
jgi:hypothetical protein